MLGSWNTRGRSPLRAALALGTSAARRARKGCRLAVFQPLRIAANVRIRRRPLRAWPALACQPLGLAVPLAAEMRLEQGLSGLALNRRPLRLHAQKHVESECASAS